MPGVDNVTYADLSRSEMYGALRALSAAIRRRAYRPAPTRLVRIPKSDGRYRELRLPTILDRVVSRALVEAVRPQLAPRLPSFGRGPWQVLLQLEREIEQRKWFLFTAADIRDCYPSLRITDVLAAHAEYVSQPDLRWLIETVVRGHEGPDKPVGLEQGNPYSPIAAELTLHSYLDRQHDAADPGQPLLLRYVDDLSILSSSVPAGRQALAGIRRALTSRGLSITSTATADLRSGAMPTILGYRVRWSHEQLELQLPRQAFVRLQKALAEAQLATAPHRSAMQIVTGWLLAAGPALTDRDNRSIMARVRQTCTRTGFQEISTPWLLHEARQARDHWTTYRVTHRADPPTLALAASDLSGRVESLPENHPDVDHDAARPEQQPPSPCDWERPLLPGEPPWIVDPE